MCKFLSLILAIVTDLLVQYPILEHFIGYWPIHQYLRTHFKNQRQHYERKEVAFLVKKEKCRERQRAEGLDSSSKVDSFAESFIGQKAGKECSRDDDEEDEDNEEEGNDEGEGGKY